MVLLNTRNGDYAAACGLDFMNPPWGHVSGPASRHPPGTYDDFATRDSNGNVLISHLYPYFTFGRSKAALLSGEPIPVQSCWNGLSTSPCPQTSENKFYSHITLTTTLTHSLFLTIISSRIQRPTLPIPPPSSPLPRHPRQSRRLARRSLRMLPRALRQPPHPHRRGLDQPGRARRLLRRSLRRRDAAGMAYPPRAPMGQLAQPLGMVVAPQSAAGPQSPLADLALAEETW